MVPPLFCLIFCMQKVCGEYAPLTTPVFRPGWLAYLDALTVPRHIHHCQNRA